MKTLEDYLKIKILFKQILDVLDEKTLQNLVNNYRKEQDAQIPLAKLFQQKATVIRETEVDAFVELTNREGEEKWKIDYVLEVNEKNSKSIIPLEFKYDGSKTEILNDIIKIHAYLRLFEDVNVSGLLLIRTYKTKNDDIDINTNTLKYHKYEIYKSDNLDVSLFYVLKSDARLISKTNYTKLSQVIKERKKEHKGDDNIIFLQTSSKL